jgi:hypothetical protein
MKRLALILIAALPLSLSYIDTPSQPRSNEYDIIRELVLSQSMTPHDEAIKAIVKASKIYSLDSRELTAIAVIESSFNPRVRTMTNHNGTQDVGMFQINTINHVTCKGLDLSDVSDNALCAAKLLSKHKESRSDYLGVYHSKTQDKKMKYIQKITKVLANTSR